MSSSRLVAGLALLAAGCGFLPPERTPRVFAHRGAAGNWPENSRTAIHESLARGYPGIEFDLVLTRDLVPVLWHDAWISAARCTHANGGPLGEGRLFVKDLTFAQLQEFRCGGLPDSDHPTLEVVPDTILGLDELLDRVARRPEVTLHFDVKWHPEDTPPLEAFVSEIFGRFRSRGLPNPYYASSTEERFIRALRAEGVPTSLTWPKFPGGENTTLVALAHEGLTQLGLGDPLAIARRSGATGLLLNYRTVDRRLVEAAFDLGLSVQLWTLNTAPVLSAYCGFPADVLITDYPERAPCL